MRKGGKPYILPSVSSAVDSSEQGTDVNRLVLVLTSSSIALRQTEGAWMKPTRLPSRQADKTCKTTLMKKADLLAGLALQLHSQSHSS